MQSGLVKKAVVRIGIVSESDRLPAYPAAWLAADAGNHRNWISWLLMARVEARLILQYCSSVWCINCSYSLCGVEATCGCQLVMTQSWAHTVALHLLRNLCGLYFLRTALCWNLMQCWLNIWDTLWLIPVAGVSLSAEEKKTIHKNLFEFTKVTFCLTELWQYSFSLVRKKFKLNSQLTKISKLLLQANFVYSAITHLFLTKELNRLSKVCLVFSNNLVTKLYCLNS